METRGGAVYVVEINVVDSPHLPQCLIRIAAFGIVSKNAFIQIDRLPIVSLAPLLLGAKKLNTSLILGFDIEKGTQDKNENRERQDEVSNRFFISFLFWGDKGEVGHFVIIFQLNQLYSLSASRQGLTDPRRFQSDDLTSPGDDNYFRVSLDVASAHDPAHCVSLS